MNNIDCLIVGAGLYGATMARLLSERGYNCFIIDRRSHLAGNIYTERNWYDGYDKHVYGPHIFHTNNSDVWEFVNCFATWEPYQQNTLAWDGERYYHLPFNMTTFCEIFGVNSISKMYHIIQKEIQESGIKEPKNLEEQAIKLVGKTIYEKLIKGYTEKQWNRPCTELSPEIIKRLPLRFTFNNNYFDDKYQAIPKEGYTKFVQNIIGNIPYLLETEFDYNFWKGKVNHIIYCGAVDELLNYKYGTLEWRSLKFNDISYDYDGYNGLGTSVINYVNKNIAKTRCVEHMYFQPRKVRKGITSIITEETPDDWELGKERYYAVNNEYTENLYNKYVELLKQKMPEVQLGGRLGKYRYFDMDDTIAEAMEDAQKIFDRDDV